MPWPSSFGNQWHVTADTLWPQSSVNTACCTSEAIKPRAWLHSLHRVLLIMEPKVGFCYNSLKLGHASFYFGFTHKIKQEVNTHFFFLLGCRTVCQVRDVDTFNMGKSISVYFEAPNYVDFSKNSHASGKRSS